MSIPDNAMIAAASLMRIELWLHNVALECIDTLHKDNIALPPLVRSIAIHYGKHCADMILSFHKAHQVLVNLSSRASMEEASLLRDLETHISVNICTF
jgi:diketogulonate reductase-like aldo/keto reductase